MKKKPSKSVVRRLNTQYTPPKGYKPYMLKDGRYIYYKFLKITKEGVMHFNLDYPKIYADQKYIETDFSEGVLFCLKQAISEPMKEDKNVRRSNGPTRRKQSRRKRMPTRVLRRGR